MINFLENQNVEIDLKELEMFKDTSNIPFILNKNNSSRKEEDDFIQYNNNKNADESAAAAKNSNSTHSTPKPEGNGHPKGKLINQTPIPEKNKFFHTKTITGDKNSLYRAIAQAILESEEDFLMIKFFIANFAHRKNELEDLYNNFYMEEFALTFYEYLDRVKDDNFLVGEFDIIMISKILNIDLSIFNLNPRNSLNNNINNYKENQIIDFNNDYSIYSNLKIVNYSKCAKPYFTVDLLYNNLDDLNDNRNTYHLLTFNKTNPYYKRLLEKKNDFSSMLNDIKFYDIKELENSNYIRSFYFSNYISPPEEEFDKPKSKFNFEFIKTKINEDMKLTIIVIVVVLTFLTLRRMF